MKVIALKRGYFGKLREPDDVFDVPAGAKASWFTPAPEDTATGAKAKHSKGKTGAAGGAAADDLV